MFVFHNSEEIKNVYFITVNKKSFFLKALIFNSLHHLKLKNRMCYSCAFKYNEHTVEILIFSTCTCTYRKKFFPNYIQFFNIIRDYSLLCAYIYFNNNAIGLCYIWGGENLTILKIYKVLSAFL